MTRLNIGDRVRLKNTGDYRAGQWATVTLAEDENYTGSQTYRVKVDNDEYGFWPFDDQIDFDSLVPEYDQDTVNAIVRYLRVQGYLGFAKDIENTFAEPKTQTVTAEFQVPVGKSLTDYLESVGIDYDITGGN